MSTEEKVAAALVRIGAVRFVPDAPITFKSGILSPVYVDNRKLPFHPDEWRVVIEGFKDVIEKNGISFDALAGVETGGIPHASALGFFMHRPSLFVRKQPKDHGTRSRIEGGDVRDKCILLVEDLVSTGLSSLSGIDALKAEGAIAADCLAIVSYGFPEAREAFAASGVRLHSLTTFPIILEAAQRLGQLRADQAEKIQEWFQDPHGWSTRHA